MTVALDQSRSVLVRDNHLVLARATSITFNTHIMVNRCDFRLMDLPFENRLQIFACMRGLPRTDHLNLLCCSKRIWNEARDSFYSRPVSFKNQADLRSATRQKTTSFCQLVQEMTLSLTNIDRTRMQEVIFQMLSGRPKTRIHSPYELESHRIITALRPYSNLRSFNLVDTAESRTTPLPGILLNEVISWVAKHHQRLTHLRIDDSNISLESLAPLGNLRSLSLSGYSETPADPTLVFPQTLSKLEKLEIVCQQRCSRYYQCPRVTKCIGSDVLQRLNPLKALRIHDEAAVDHQFYLTVAMIEAIMITHSGNLRELSLSSTISLDSTVVEKLVESLRFMQQLHTLAMMWPDFDTSTLASLPPTIWSLECLVRNEKHAKEVMKVLDSTQDQLPRLRKIKFRSSERKRVTFDSFAPVGSWDISFEDSQAGAGA